MIRSGMASVTFRDLKPVEIVDIARQAGLDAIEWGGDVHVPHGEIELAREVAAITRNAGVEVSSYGSYSRAGCKGGSNPLFEDVARTALALGAPLIRIWAGDRGSRDAGPAWWNTVVQHAREMADIAQESGMTVAFEFHGHTLTDTAETARHLLEETNHPGVSIYWQPPVSLEHEARMEGLKLVTPWLSNLHVFHYQDGEQAPLAEGADEWRQYLAHVNSRTGDRYALLEFVEGGKPDNLLRDAATLKALLAEL